MSTFPSHNAVVSQERQAPTHTKPSIAARLSIISLYILLQACTTCVADSISIKNYFSLFFEYFLFKVAQSTICDITEMCYFSVQTSICM